MKHAAGEVLFILEHFHPCIGGVETLFLQLSETLVKNGIPVTVVTLKTNRESPVYEAYHGVLIRRIRALNRFWFALCAVPAAIWYARKASLIQTSTFAAGFTGWIAGRITGTKVVITVHEVWDTLWLSFPWMQGNIARFYRLLERVLLKLPFDRYVAVSEATARAMAGIGIPEDRTITIRNGVDYDRLKSYLATDGVKDRGEQSSPSFVYYGRLGHSKGLDLIVEGGRLFLESNPDGSIVLVVPAAPATFRKRLEGAIAATGHQNSFVLVPPLPEDELFKLISSCTAVLIPSRNEGFSYVAAECTAIGIPMIISGKGALQETAGGRVVEMESFSAEGLCAAMHKAASGLFGVRPRDRFPLQEQADRYLLLYRDLTTGQLPL
ncbi:MAG TPA: glycosyltransferase family 4 protein [Bacteroidales bacterium]|nr:glycosyltransferase family 4 protein [Bacteroidales bacterium]HRZ48290.1 glycosyltransferase family 4 protein [Bacteroidales bacterium]